MQTTKRITIALPILIVALCASGCESSERIIAGNKHLCEKHGGFNRIYAANSHLPRLLLCNDGSVKWANDI